jgi:hypothetical protein
MIMDKAKKIPTRKAPMGVRRMTVVICCVIIIGAIDGVHACLIEPMGAGTMTAIAAITALGGVDIWKSGLLKKG